MLTFFIAMMSIGFFIFLKSPNAVNILTWIFTLCFLAPFLSFICGTFVWAVCVLVSIIFYSGGWWTLDAYLGCCACAGLPFGAFMSWTILSK